MNVMSQYEYLLPFKVIAKIDEGNMIKYIDWGNIGQSEDVYAPMPVTSVFIYDEEDFEYCRDDDECEDLRAEPYSVQAEYNVYNEGMSLPTYVYLTNAPADEVFIDLKVDI